MLVRLSKVCSCPFTGYTSPADGFTGLETAAVAGDVGAGGAAVTVILLKRAWIGVVAALPLRHMLNLCCAPPREHFVAYSCHRKQHRGGLHAISIIARCVAGKRRIQHN